MRGRFRLLLVLSVAACRQGGVDAPLQADGGSSGDGGTGYPPPRADLVDRIGTAGAVDIATWNVEYFPTDESTPSLVADLIASLDLDLVAVQEISDVGAFEELVARLPDHDGILSSHTYGNQEFADQKIGFLYRSDLLRVEAGALLFEGDGFAFPRPPLQVEVSVLGTEVEFVAIALHLKAGIGSADRDRRREAIAILEAHIAELVGGGADRVIALGDYNESVDHDAGREVFAPFLARPDAYDLRTQGLTDAGAYSFIPFERVIDHVVTTAGLADDMAGTEAQIPPLDVELSVYRQLVSDHLPVAVAMPVL